MSFRNIGRKVSGAIKKVTGSSSSRSSSRRLSTPTPSYTHQDEQAESLVPEEKPAQQEEEEAPDDSHLDIRGLQELQAYNILKARTFGHTWEFDEDLLEKTCMNAEFVSVWKAVGWSSFAEISKLGSRDLTIQFLCTLVETNNGISFRFFGAELSLTRKELSTILGFHHKCSLDLEQATKGYHRESFWHTISGLNAYTHPVAIIFSIQLYV